ncbi:MAG: hypothetical protein CME06_04375 [Gemmatimonadetes bacterium]|nr:hypothetical protein [Gemmatimonadota bacterium]
MTTLDGGVRKGTGASPGRSMVLQAPRIIDRAAPVNLEMGQGVDMSGNRFLHGVSLQERISAEYPRIRHLMRARAVRILALGFAQE